MRAELRAAPLSHSPPSRGLRVSPGMHLSRHYPRHLGEVSPLDAPGVRASFSQEPQVSRAGGVTQVASLSGGPVTPVLPWQETAQTALCPPCLPGVHMLWGRGSSGVVEDAGASLAVEVLSPGKQPAPIGPASGLLQGCACAWPSCVWAPSHAGCGPGY